MSMTRITLSSSWATMICLPSGVKNASSGVLKVCPGARSPGRGNCHMVRPRGSMIINRWLCSSAIRIGPGNAEGLEPEVSLPGPEAVRVRGAMAAVVGRGGGDGVVEVAAGLTESFCAVGVEGVTAAAMNHHAVSYTHLTLPTIL